MSFRDPLPPTFYFVISVVLGGFLPPVPQQMLSKSTCKLGHHTQKNTINIPAINEMFQQMCVLHRFLNMEIDLRQDPVLLV